MHFLLFFTTELSMETTTRPTDKIILYENLRISNYTSHSTLHPLNHHKHIHHVVY